MGCLIALGFWAGKPLSATLVIEPEYARIGGTFTVKGEGFGANEDVLVEAIGSTTTVKSSGDRRFSCTFYVSLICGGEHVVTATSQSKVENGTIWIIPTVNLVPSSGLIGDKIEVSGMGYGAKERIQVGIGKYHCVAEIYTDNMGIFSTSFIVPDLPKGNSRLFAIGHTTYLLAENNFYRQSDVFINTTSPATTTTNITFTLNIIACDSDGNTATTFSGTITIRNITNSIFPTTIQLTNGTWTGIATITTSPNGG